MTLRSKYLRELLLVCRYYFCSAAKQWAVSDLTVPVVSFTRNYLLFTQHSSHSSQILIGIVVIRCSNISDFGTNWIVEIRKELLTTKTEELAQQIPQNQWTNEIIAFNSINTSVFNESAVFFGLLCEMEVERIRNEHRQEAAASNQRTLFTLRWNKLLIFC